ncbi:hypothetical protein THAOC_25237 [Thalassiosira oceanica]|uniref:Uncharacterized protein n=1 Tax=Thalassiosira oceanica TaxID=159749 RepID=K0RRS8_THAOC|nr:hypothetical protein THAOC_25237 [Thalassiosira oceanica]|eukprot:EJK55069.1 hypothetical protein THAOC_25237 [Thalassiosira oceanica]
MDRLTGIERPCEPSPTSHGTRVKAGATRPAPGGLWGPHNAYRSRNLTRIQVNHEPSAGGHGYRPKRRQPDFTKRPAFDALSFGAVPPRRHHAMLDEFNRGPDTGDGHSCWIERWGESGFSLGLPIDFYGPNIKRNLLPTLSASHVCVPDKCNMLLTTEFPLFQFPSNMELTSPPIAVCLVSSGTSNEGNIQVFRCQEAPGGTILGT